MTIDECRSILAPVIGWHRKPHFNGWMWHLVRTNDDGQLVVIGRGATPLGAYRQAADRLLRFGTDKFLAIF